VALRGIYLVDAVLYLALAVGLVRSRSLGARVST
jgi:hypothetical protein